ncbi:GGDEF domain-containing protein [Saccharopolyspora taberi]|uniref:GGDEF domain-containing protein n=1 Tax=Saccharopolyspora taberi TaxID=60895 RepID=A0ABN3VAE7_9PSEU
MIRNLHAASLALAATALTGWALTARHARRLAAQARIDPLTGALRRGPFIAAAEEKLRRTDNLAIAVADVDNLKPINDEFGHAAGDLVLAATARRLAEPLSGHLPLVGRLGGDEFAMVYVAPDPHDLRALAGRLREPVDRAGLPALPAGVSFGVATCNRRATCTLARALDVADAAMYQDKNHHRAISRTTSLLARGGRDRHSPGLRRPG